MSIALRPSSRNSFCSALETELPLFGYDIMQVRARFGRIPAFFLLFACAIAAAPALAATAPASPVPPIRADQARANQGQNVTVRGVVRDAHRDARLGSYLDFDSSGPSPLFAGYIPKGNEAQFPSFEKLRGHEVELTGTIRIRDGYPIIMMTNASQLRIVR